MTVRMDGWRTYQPVDEADDASDCIFLLADGTDVTLSRKQMRTMAENGSIEVETK